MVCYALGILYGILIHILPFKRNRKSMYTRILSEVISTDNISKVVTENSIMVELEVCFD